MIEFMGLSLTLLGIIRYSITGERDWAFVTIIGLIVTLSTY